MFDAIIPLRSGSKGIPGKNIKLLNGKPLINWTIEAAKKSLILAKKAGNPDYVRMNKANIKEWQK